MYFYEVVKPKLFWRETRIKAKNLPINYDDDDDEGKIKATTYTTFHTMAVALRKTLSINLILSQKATP